MVQVRVQGGGEGFSEDNSQTSRSKKGGEYLDQPSNYKLTPRVIL